MNVPPGPLLPAQRKRDLLRSFLLSTIDGIFAIPIGLISLPGNVLLVVLVTEAFRFSDSAFGIFMALPFIANFLQIFAMPLLAQWRPAKFVTAFSAALHLLSWIALGCALPWLRHLGPVPAAHWLMGWFLVSSLFAAVNGVAWNAWTQQWVPARLRGKFFGERNRWVQVAALVFLAAAGWVLGRWHSAIPVFQGLIAVVSVMRVVSLRCLWRTPALPLKKEEEVSLPLREKIRILGGSTSFLLFSAFGCAWSFAANCLGPFYPVFMFGPMRMSAFEVGMTATLAQLGGALSLPVWGGLLDRYGNKPVMIVSLVFWQLSNFFWCFAIPANHWMLYLLWLWAGATGAGFALGLFTLLLRVLPVEAKNLAIGFNLAVTSLFAAAAPIAGGYALQWALGRNSDPLEVYHLFFALPPVLALAGAALLWRVREPAASSLAVVVGAMRNIRTLGGVLGLGFLTNYLFLKPGARPPKADRAKIQHEGG